MSATELLLADAAGVARAARLIRAGEVVAFPTETVYGLGGLATDDRAVARIFEAKARPRFNPLICHFPSLTAAREFARFERDAERLAEEFWPGPLTLVLPPKPGSALSALATAGLPTMALRVPDHPIALALAKTVDAPLAGPSANPSGRASPTRADHVLSGLDGRISAVLDGGPCGVGIESTIVGFLPSPTLMRPGGLAPESIEACLGSPLALPDACGTTSAPGQMRSHYATRARLRLEATAPEPGELHLGFGTLEGDLNLSEAGDLVEAAANLFAHLHSLDGCGALQIAVAPIPDRGLGLAINDRLRRAAAPRPDRAGGRE